MASNIEERQLLRWFTSLVTALTSSAASGGGTTSVVAMITSVTNMNAADTGLSAAEKRICTQISSAIGTTTPTSSMATIL